MWTGFIRLRVGTVMSLDSLKYGHILTGRGTDTFSKRTLLRRCNLLQMLEKRDTVLQYAHAIFTATPH